MFMHVVRKDAFNRLSKKDRQVMMKHGGEGFARSMVRLWQADIDRDVAKAKADPKRNIISYSAAQLKHRAARFKPMHTAWIKKTPRGQEKFDALMGILKRMRAGN